jgi:hypothetical protein
MNPHSEEVIIVGMYLNPVTNSSAVCYIILIFFFVPFQTFLVCMLTVLIPVFQKTNNWSCAMNLERSE